MTLDALHAQLNALERTQDEVVEKISKTEDTLLLKDYEKLYCENSEKIVVLQEKIYYATLNQNV